MIGKMIFSAIILMGSMPAAAGDKIADFEKTCVKLKKKAGVCSCLSSNVKRRLASGDLNDDQIPVAIQALKGEAPQGEAKSPYYENLADFLAGLEPACMKNAKYNVDQP